MSLAVRTFMLQKGRGGDLAFETGAAVGAQIGATATRYFAGPRIRLFFSMLPLAGAILVILRLLGWEIPGA